MIPVPVPIEPLEKAIVDVVASNHGVDVHSLGVLMRDTPAAAVSRATLYRRVSDLIDRQILIRNRGKLFISLLWRSSLLQASKALEQAFESKIPETLQIPEREGRSREFSADSLSALDSVWNSLHMELGLRFRQTEWYGYNARTWYALGMPDTEARLHESFVLSGFRYHLLYGNDSFLDRLGAEWGRVDGYRTEVASCPELPQSGYIVWASEGFTIECRFPDEVNSKFESVFKKTLYKEDFNRADFESIFRMKARCALKVKRSAKEAAYYRGLLKPYFYPIHEDERLSA